MSSDEAQSSFPGTTQRLAFCESAYDHRRHGQNSFVQSVSVKAATCAARKTTFLGRTFRVVPAVLVRSQVLRNNLGATFLPEEEITDDWAAQWNGIPVLVGPHPSMRGAATSGRTPEIWNERGVGWIFGAKAENAVDGTRRLIGEVWLDEARAAVVEGFPAVLARLDAGQPVELSTGFATQTEEVSGAYNGEAYEMVLHPQGADHLVISTEMTGACAVADGCGLGANQEATVEDPTKVEVVNEAPMQSVGGTPHPASDFAYVPDPQQSSTWKLPIFDAEHVRAALARFNQTDLPPTGRAHAWRRILAAADAHQVTVADRTMPSHNESGVFKALLARVVELFGKDDQKAMSWETHEEMRMKRALTTLQLTPSDSERAQMLKEVLQEMFGDYEREVIVCDVYTEPESYVVFWFMTPMGPMPKGMEYYQVAWAVDSNGDGKPEVKGEPVLVRRQTSYEPVGSGSALGAGNESPAGEAATPAVQSHIAQEDGKMADKEKAQELGELTAGLATLTAAIEKLNTKVEGLERMSAPAEIAGLKRTVGELAASFEQMKGVTKKAVDELERERQYLVTTLAGNHKVPFSSAELESKPLEDLRKLAQMALGDNYAGQGGPHSTGADSEQRFAVPRPYWAVEKGGK